MRNESQEILSITIYNIIVALLFMFIIQVIIAQFIVDIIGSDSDSYLFIIFFIFFFLSIVITYITSLIIAIEFIDEKYIFKASFLAFFFNIILWAFISQVYFSNIGIILGDTILDKIALIPRSILNFSNYALKSKTMIFSVIQISYSFIFMVMLFIIVPEKQIKQEKYKW